MSNGDVSSWPISDEPRDVAEVCNRGGSRHLHSHTLIETAKPNDVDPLAWLAGSFAGMVPAVAKSI
jgi:hypothetical protein